MNHSTPFVRRACAAALLTFVAACSKDAPTGTSSGDTSGGGTGTVRVVNSTTRPIFFVYLSPCADTEWGPDRLGADVISAGASFQFTNLRAGCWDARAVLDNNQAAERLGFTVTAGQVFTWTPAASAFASIARERAAGVAADVRAAAP